jgi:hypothetical protein
MAPQTWPGLTEDEITKKRLDDMAVISVNFAPGYATILTKDVKATFSDKLGTVGGTFGIFVGVSFLSLYEIFVDLFYFIQKKILKSYSRRR